MRKLTIHSLFMNLTIALLVSAVMAPAWAKKAKEKNSQPSLKEKVKSDQEKYYEKLKAEQAAEKAKALKEKEARAEKTKTLRENLCAEDPAKSQTGAVGVCLNCLKAASQDEVEKIKIDTSKMEVEEREKKFFLFMQGKGHFKKPSNLPCESMKDCEVILKRYDVTIAEELAQWEKNKKRNDDSYAELEALIESDLKQVPLPKSANRNGYIYSVFMKNYGVPGNPQLSKKWQEAFSKWSYGSDQVFLDEDVEKIFKERAKGIKKQDYPNPTNQYEKERRRIMGVIEGLKDADKERIQKPTDDEVVKELKGSAEKNLEGISKKPTFKRCSLSTAELFALYDYSSSGYTAVNGALRAGGEKAEQYEPYRQVLNSALKKLRPYGDFVDRGADLPEKVLEQYQVGAVIDSPAFSSTSVFSGFSKRHKFTIKTKTGAYIAPYSTHSDEEEVLIPAGVKFKVLERKDGPSKGSVQIVMEEVDP